MDKLVGFLKTMSWLLFLGALLWAYAYLPPQVTYRLDSSGAAAAVMGRGAFFFSSLGFFLVVNIVCIVFLRMLKKIESSEDGVGLRNRSLKKDIITWVHGFIGILNLFFAIIVAFVAYMNGPEDFQVSSLGALIYVGPVLIFAWFIYLARLLSKKRD